MKHHILLGVCSALVLTAAVPALGQDTDRSWTPVTDEMILDPNPSDWLQWRGTVNNWGYSPLDQINTDTVGDLELVWSWALGQGGQQEVAPIVHDGIMFLAENQNYLEALDAETGDLIWSYTHTRPEFEGGYHNNQAQRQKNSIALYGDSVILTTVDARLIALDALTGQVQWDVQVNDWEAGYSFTAGPLVADGKVFTGTSGCSIVGTAGACWFTAHDATNGEELWRFNTLASPEAGEEIEASWNGVPQENRWGASIWATATYDADLDMVFFGTGMPIPYAEITRGTGDGDVLYTNSTIALDADTGEMVWYYQHLPRDNWDLDSPFERMVIDAEVDGETRKMIVSTPGKNGVTFGLDAATGEFIYAQETVYQNSVIINHETGEVAANVDLIPTEFGEPVTVCPAIPGGRLWQATAYSPDTGLFYLPAANTCQTAAAQEMGEASPGSAVGFYQSFGDTLAPGASGVGSLHALDAATGEPVFDIQQGPRFTSAVLTTGGGLLFVGDADRYIQALDASSGEELWRHRLQAPIGGNPMTYEVNGVQYLVIAAGQSNQTHPALTPGLAVPRQGANSIHVFRLRD